MRYIVAMLIWWKWVVLDIKHMIKHFHWVYIPDHAHDERNPPMCTLCNESLTNATSKAWEYLEKYRK